MLKTVGNPSTRYGNQTIVDGDLVIGTAGKGVDFSANTNAPGMTSELLDWYEEGTWTPTLEPGVSGTWTVTATYTRVGRLVFFNIVQTSGTISAASGVGVFTNLPFAPARASSLTYTNSAASLSGVGLLETNSTVYAVDAISNQTALRFSGAYEV